MSDYSELLAKMQEYLEWSDDVIVDGATSATIREMVRNAGEKESAQ